MITDDIHPLTSKEESEFTAQVYEDMIKEEEAMAEYAADMEADYWIEYEKTYREFS